MILPVPKRYVRGFPACKRMLDGITVHAMNRCAAMTMLTITLLGSGCVNRMFYYPTADVYDVPSRHGLPYEPVDFFSRDGTRLTGWFLPATGEPRGTVVHYHGNAQNLTAHFAFVSWLPREGFNVFVFDYRGYGRSEGVPDRRGVHEDGLAALDYVMKRPDVHPERVVVLGQSLGGAVAVAALASRSERPVKAVVIDSSFYSYQRIVRDKIRGIPVLSWFRWPLSWLVVSNRRSPGPVIHHLAPIPLLVIHGTDDEVIPPAHGRKLFEAAGEPKTLVMVPGGRHTDALVHPDPRYRKQVVDFFMRALNGRR